MKLRPVLIVFLLGMALLAVSVLPASAQASSTCPALVERAMTELGMNCTSPARNSACYGYNNVTAAFSEAVAPDFFSKPSDRAALSQLDSLQTAALDAETGTWGIATLNVQANLPNALPGQNAVFLLLGDVLVENDVSPEDRLILPDAPLDVQTTQAARLHGAPDASAEILSSVGPGDNLLADGISPDGQWLRVFFMAGRQTTAWVNIGDVEASSAFNDLPVITPQSRTPMQAFRLQTSVSGGTCEEAPSALVVQGPQNITVDITANGADIQIGSTIVLWTLPNGALQIAVLWGGATLNPHSPSPIFLPPGFTAICGRAAAVNGNCLWSVPRVITPAEQRFLGFIGPLLRFIGNLLHYVVDIPELICPSGVGSVTCELRFNNPAPALAYAREQCAAGLLLPPACRLLFPDETA